MSDPFYPGVQSNLVYGIETTVEETRMVDGVCVVVSKHDTCHTYESPTSPQGAPAYTTVCDHVTTSYSGRPPYLVSPVATNQNTGNMNFPSPMIQSNSTPTSYFNNTPQTYPFVQNNSLDQTHYSNFTPAFNSTAYSQNPYQPNQTFQPSFINNTTQFSQPKQEFNSQFSNSMNPNPFSQPNQTFAPTFQNNTTQFTQPNQDFTSQFPNATSPYSFSQPTQTSGQIENQLCCPCSKDLMDQILAHILEHPFQPGQSNPVNYNFFLVHQDQTTPTPSGDEPMVTNDTDDNSWCSRLCVEDVSCHTSTSTSDLRKWEKDDPCATSTPSAWPREDKRPAFVFPAVGTQTEDNEKKGDEKKTEKIIESKLKDIEEEDNEKKGDEKKTEEIIESKLKVIEEEDNEKKGDDTKTGTATNAEEDSKMTTQEIISTILDEILPLEDTEISENNHSDKEGKSKKTDKRKKEEKKKK